MHRRTYRSCFCLLLLLLVVGCQDEIDQRGRLSETLEEPMVKSTLAAEQAETVVHAEPAEAAVQEQALDLELARAALVKLAESSDEPAFQVSIEWLRTAPFKMEENGWATMGAWRVHVKKRQFGVDVVSPPLFEQWEGEFMQNKQGEWIATVRLVART